MSDDGINVRLGREDLEGIVVAENCEFTDNVRVPAGTPLTAIFPNGIYASVRGDEVVIFGGELPFHTNRVQGEKVGK